MKIAVSVLGNMSEDNGTTVRAKRIFELLKKRYDTKLIARGGKNKELENTIIVKPERTKLWNLKLIPIIIKNKFDCIYCSGDFLGFMTYYLLSKIYSYKIIFEAHGIKSVEYKEGHPDGLINRFKFRMFQILEKFVVKHADYIIALSPDIYEFYKRYNKNIDLIPVFVDEDRFRMSEKAKDKRYDKKGEKLIGLIGPFEFGNINMYFLDFLYNNLNKFNEKIKFVIIGKCDYKIKNERIIYTDYLDDIQDYVNQLATLDAVLIPSKLPSFGPLNKILEPMSCSVPVFTTPIGVIGLDNIENGNSIFIFEEDELIGKINEMIFHEKLMEKVGNNARITVEKYYGKKVNETKLVKIMEDLKR